MTEQQEEQQVTFEQVLQAYEQRLQEQTGIIFALVAKAGGTVTLTKDDLLAQPEFNTVAANDAPEGDGIVLSLEFQEQGDA